MSNFYIKKNVLQLFVDVSIRMEHLALKVYVPPEIAKTIFNPFLCLEQLFQQPSIVSLIWAVPI